MSMNDLNEFTGLVRRVSDDYGMLCEGDRVAVGISGGKDSLVLLLAMRHLQSYYPARFELEALTADLGFEGMDFEPIADLCAELGIPYTRIKTDIREIVFDVRQESNPSSLCAKMRRGALNTAVRERGCNKLALATTLTMPRKPF
jgi:tRNA(Ile)-lysidine synthase TilS/MesJ